MKELFLCFPESFRILFSDKKLRTYTLLPMGISFLIYLGIAIFFLINLSSWVHVFVASYLVSYISSAILHYLVSGLMFILFVFLFNWTFVLMVSLISAPFNALISDRIETMMRPGQEIKKAHSSWWVIKNELLKISCSILFTLGVIGIGIVPFMGIISIILSSLLVAFNFLDFSWSRHSWSWDKGLKDLFQNFFYYIFGGFLFLTLISVPFINLMVPVWGTSYFTLLWLKKN